MDPLKTTSIGIASAVGSSGSVYGIHYLVTKDSNKETTSINKPKSENLPRENEVSENQEESLSGSQKQTSQTDYTKLKEWMKNNKCTIKTVSIEPTGGNIQIINLEENNNVDEEMIKSLLTWLETENPNNKEKLGCNGNDQKNNLVVKTIDKKQFEIKP